MKNQQLIENLKSVVSRLAVEGAMKFLIGKAAFLAWPILGPLARLLVSKLVSIVIEVIDQQGYFMYVSHQKNEQADNFVDAARKNAEVQKNGTEEEKLKAEQALIDAHRKLVKFRL